MCLVSGLGSSKILNPVHVCKTQLTASDRMTEVKTDPAWLGPVTQCQVRALAGQTHIPLGPGLTEGHRVPTVLPRSSP